MTLTKRIAVCWIIPVAVVAVCCSIAGEHASAVACWSSVAWMSWKVTKAKDEE